MSRVENSASASVVTHPPVGRKKSKSSALRNKPATARQPAETPAAPGSSAVRLQLLAVAWVFAAGVWAYWPTLQEFVATWNREPDYSHGFLVPPLAILFLWLRRKSFPGWGQPAYLLGGALLATNVAARYLGARFYMEFIDGYSILLWVASVAALLGGWRLLLWALPSIGFLFFMIPLPFGMESQLSYPLQRIATKLSCFALQVLGQPAFPEGNVILLGDHPPLEVAQACSGLRLFVSMVAVAYAYVVLVQRTWWEKGLLFLAVVPVAIVSNATRIVTTGLLYQFTTGELAHWFAHESAGYAMIVLAMALFAGVLWFLSKLIREEEVLEMSDLMRDAKV